MRVISRTIVPLICLIMVSLPTFLIASDQQPPSPSLQGANEAYSQGRFDEAISMYSKLIADNGLSPELLHNLANSYAGKGENGRAILNYLRGLRLAPGDDDLQGDLAMTRKNIGLFADKPGIKERTLTFFDFNQWFILALAAYLLATLLSVLLFWKKNLHWLRTCIGSLAVSIIVCLFAAFQQLHIWNGGIIITPQTTLLMSPFSSAASLGVIDEGVLVNLEKSHGSYIYIRDERGRAGWIPAQSYETINTHHLTYAHGDTEQ